MEQKQTQAKDKLLDLDQMAYILNISNTTLYRFIKRYEEFPVVKIGKVYRFDRNEVIKWFKLKRKVEEI